MREEGFVLFCIGLPQFHPASLRAQLFAQGGRSGQPQWPLRQGGGGAGSCGPGLLLRAPTLEAFPSLPSLSAAATRAGRTRGCLRHTLTLTLSRTGAHGSGRPHPVLFV